MCTPAQDHDLRVAQSSTNQPTKQNRKPTMLRSTHYTAVRAATLLDTGVFMHMCHLQYQSIDGLTPTHLNC
jgi:hypothetical protein